MGIYLKHSALHIQHPSLNPKLISKYVTKSDNSNAHTNTLFPILMKHVQDDETTMVTRRTRPGGIEGKME